LQEASRLGTLHVYLWSDELTRKVNGTLPKFPQEERLYFLKAIRYVDQVHLIDQIVNPSRLPLLEGRSSGTWVVPEDGNTPQKNPFPASSGMRYHVVRQELLNQFPQGETAVTGRPSTKKVIVTGCYDWLHSGHIRFFEEVSALGDLYVVAGSDENVQLLKGEGHPLFPQDERRFMVQSIRFVTQAWISTGQGWMDAAPEIDLIKPDIYAVNEDGDKPEKRDYCRMKGIEYVVLKRLPKKGLPKRISTDLRGF